MLVVSSEKGGSFGVDLSVGPSLLLVFVVIWNSRGVVGCAAMETGTLPELTSQGPDFGPDQSPNPASGLWSGPWILTPILHLDAEAAAVDGCDRLCVLKSEGVDNTVALELRNGST